VIDPNDADADAADVVSGTDCPVLVVFLAFTTVAFAITCAGDKDDVDCYCYYCCCRYYCYRYHCNLY
jgi:hypothetical protein